MLPLAAALTLSVALGDGDVRHLKPRKSSRAGSNPLPSDLEELQELCETAGLHRACTQLEHHGYHAKNAPNFFEKASLTPRGDATCLPAGRLVFAHVMKTGGLAVDSFLNCRCSESNVCSVRHADGVVQTVGPAHCRSRPSICTMHRGVAEISTRCGPIFSKKPKIFTVIRDPVERVWSFYNYLKRWYTPYQNMGITAVLENLGQDLNENLPTSQRCAFCKGELSNAMTLRYFCPDTALCMSMWQGDGLTTHKISKALNLSKQMLASMDAIFLTDDLHDLPALFDSARRLFPELTASVRNKAGCSTSSDVVNPTNYQVSLHTHAHPNFNAIARKNWADVELYRYAMLLPNLIRSESSSNANGGYPGSESKSTASPLYMKKTLAKKAAKHARQKWRRSSKRAQAVRRAVHLRGQETS